MTDIKNIIRWRGKKPGEYKKYVKRKREKEKDYFFHSVLGYTLKNPKKYYSKKEMKIMNKNKK